MTPEQLEVFKAESAERKKKLPPGPWHEELDRVVGAWCGYVGVPKGHRLFGVGYSECAKKAKCSESYCEDRPESLLGVHGGLTYAAACSGPLCHVGTEKRNDYILKQAEGLAVDVVDGINDLRGRRLRTVDLETLLGSLREIRHHLLRLSEAPKKAEK